MGKTLPASTAFLIPFLWMLSTSLKGDTQIFVYPPIWIPDPFAWDNFPRALSYISYLKYFTNTMIIAAASMVGVVMSSALVAYSLARLQWPGRDLLFRLLAAVALGGHAFYHGVWIAGFLLRPG